VPRLDVGGVVVKEAVAALLPGDGRGESGVLPVSLFGSVYLDAAAGFVVFRK
jgi:hypothetical protein